MKDIKGSAGAKIAAWAAISISGILFLGSIAGAFLLVDMGVYVTSEKEMRRDAFRSAAEQYSIIALSNMQSDNNGNKMFSEEVENFQYGIIKAEAIDGKDFNKDSTYVERNFTEKVAEEDLYKVSYEIGPNTQFRYSGTLYGGYSVTNPEETYEKEEEISAVCYDSEKGIFYYEVGDEIYPVQHIEVEMFTEEDSGTIYEFEFDNSRRQYQNVSPYIGGEEEQEISVNLSGYEAIDEEVSDESVQKKQKAYEILSRNYITFNLFEGTSVSEETWRYFRLDGKDYYGMQDIIIYETGDQHFTEETRYYREGDFLYITRTKDDEKETYWVVSILPENIKAGESADLFVQADRLLDAAYALRYGIIIIILLSFAAGLGLFLFLVSAAGHRKGTDKIVRSWIDGIPLEIYAGIAAFAEILLGYLTIEVMRYMDVSRNFVVMGCIGTIGILCMGWIALLSVLTITVRIKAGTLFKSTILWHIFQWADRLFVMFMENMTLFWKAGVLFLGITILELFLLIVIVRGGVTGILLWFVEKFLLALLTFLVILQMRKLKEGAEVLAEGDLSYCIDTERMFWEFKKHGENLNSISRGMSRAVDERMKSEYFKTELITNVSHDIKTPLTSIINYVDLLGKEELENASAEEYIEVLQRQSGRLKKLIEDLMEASKASTGNIEVHLEKLEAGVSMVQIIGEFEEKTKENGLELIIRKPENPVYIMADSRHFWRVIDNLMNNICKYAQPSTRVYINLEEPEGAATITFRNTSRYALNISSEELMERFVRGDSSRNTEGSGLGLSIAQCLMELMGGSLVLYVDGDLFKVTLKFAVPA